MRLGAEGDPLGLAQYLAVAEIGADGGGGNDVVRCAAELTSSAMAKYLREMVTVGRQGVQGFVKAAWVGVWVGDLVLGLATSQPSTPAGDGHGGFGVWGVWGCGGLGLYGRGLDPPPLPARAKHTCWRWSRWVCAA